jgi:hypothetical protein
MTKQGSLLYLRHQHRSLEAQLRLAERRLHDDDLSVRVHAAGEIVRLERRCATVARMIATMEADADGLWTGLKDELRVDLDAISSAVGDVMRHR